MDSKAGSWQQSGGLLQPAWLFRRKASPFWPTTSRKEMMDHFWPTASKRADGYGGLAQLGERLPCKQEVSGSIPLISTTKKRLTEIPKEFEVSLSLLKKKLKHAP